MTGHQAEIGFSVLPSNLGKNIVGDITGQGMNPLLVAVAPEPEREAINRIYRPRDWNDLVIRCEGSRETIELNGVKTAEINDSAAPKSGRIGFQLFDKPEIEFRNVRIRDLSAGTEARPASPVVSANPATVLLDVDFRKTDGGFRQGDQDHILAEHKNGEYRYLGKKTGYWFGGLHPVFFQRKNNQLRDFAIEVDVRLVGRKKGWFAIEFGRSGDETLYLALDQSGKVKLWRSGGALGEDLVPPMASPAMRPVEEFNTLRLAVENKTIRASVNGSRLFEKRLERYAGAPVCLWLASVEPVFNASGWRDWVTPRLPCSAKKFGGSKGIPTSSAAWRFCRTTNGPSRSGIAKPSNSGT